MLDKENNPKFLGMSILAPIILALIFSVAIYPMANMNMKDMPVAVVSEDEGITAPGPVNAGNAILQNIRKIDQQNEAIDITVMDHKEKAIEKAENGDFCAVMVIPADFTKKQMTMGAASPQSPEIALYINQGNYGMLGTMMETAMKTMVDQMGKALKPQVAAAYAKAGVSISEEQLAYYEAPITSSVEHIDPVDNMGTGMMSANGHGLAGMMTWMATLIATIMLYLFNRKHAVTNIRVSRVKINIQILVGAISAVVAAISIALILKYIIGFDIQVGATFCYVMFVIFGFMMLIYGMMRWIGFGGLALAALAMFLSMGTIYVPYETLPGFWQNWIYPWAPIRIIGEGFKEVFFLNGSWFNHVTVTMLVLAAIGIALAYLSLLREEKIKEA